MARAKERRQSSTGTEGETPEQRRRAREPGLLQRFSPAFALRYPSIVPTASATLCGARSHRGCSALSVLEKLKSSRGWFHLVAEAATSATERVWGVRPISVSVQCMDMHRTACCLYATICVSRIWNGRAQGTAVWAARHVCASISTTRCAPAKRAVRAPRCPGQLGPDWCGRHSGGRLFTGGVEEEKHEKVRV